MSRKFAKSVATLRRKSAATRIAHETPKVTTFRLDPATYEGLVLLSEMTKKPLNKLVNEAVEGFVGKRCSELESGLQSVLARLKAYRKSDPNHKRAIEEFIDAEARFGAKDPAEGHRVSQTLGPAQSMVQKLLSG